MNSHHTVLDLASIAIVLPGHPNGLLAALRRARLVHATDGFGMSVVVGNDLLALVTQPFFIPLNRFKKPLQSSRCGIERQGDRFGGLAVQIRELPFDINM